MSFRTTCPQCASVFRLGRDQLAAAGGWVQCGVCGAAFDAHSSLLLEDGSAVPLTATSASADSPEQEYHAADTRQTETASGDSFRHESPPTLPLGGESGTPAPDAPETETPPAAACAPDLAVDDAAPFEPVAAIVRNLPAASFEYPSVFFPSSKQHRIMPWIWGMASVLLGILLLAQTAYFLRDAIASKLPQTRPALERACATLGCSLSLPKNPDLLQIIGSDLQTEAADQLRLSLTLGNRADQAQAWPVLVLTLTDQRNRPLARRSFAPSEYLGDPRRIASGIPPRSEQPLSLPLTVNKLAPMGFNLQLVY